MWWEVITEALLDTLKLFPFLFLLYILIELTEHNTRIGKPNGALTGKAAPAVGAAVGLVPMCGFSVMAAKLYERRHVTLGTLAAVFIATSDEALFVLALSPMGWLEKLVSILAMLGIKAVLGAGAGYLIDLVLKRRRAPLAPLPAPEAVHEHEEHGHDADGHECAHGEHDREHEEHGEGELTVCEHRHGHRSTLSLYLVSPLLHALKIAAFILVFNLAFGYLFFGIGGGSSEVGEERVIGFLQGAGYWYQPLVCSLIGFIPNCASSVALSEAYAVGGIAFGSLVGGLVTNAGLGYLVLFKDPKNIKSALLMSLFMIVLGIATGYLVNAVMQLW